jgi:hypothetical protein
VDASFVDWHDTRSIFSFPSPLFAKWFFTPCSHQLGTIGSDSEAFGVSELVDFFSKHLTTCVHLTKMKQLRRLGSNGLDIRCILW